LPETDEEGGGADEKESLAGDFAVPETKKSSTFQAASFFSSSSKKAKKSAWLEVLNFCAKATLARIVPVVVSAVAAVAALGLARRYVPAALRPVPAAMQLVKERVREGFQGVQQMAEATAEVTAEATAEVLSAEPKDEAEGALQEVLWLLATCVAVVPFISEMPGGSSVLGFLMGGALIGPHALGIVQNVNTVSHIAEFGVVFLMFNIGLELSLERLQSMQKYVFGLGSVQVLSCALAISVVSVYLYGLAGPASVLVGCGLALSSTAVALQVLQDRGESNNRHGRATFSALLFQDLAVVLFLMMIPLLANSVSGGAVGLRTIGAALGQAGLKSVVCITGIILGGRLMFRPIYKRIAATQNAEVFRATTLLVALGTSELTQMAGLSMELGAFLAGLLLAETEYHLQIESDIAPFRGLLLGLFFMTIGMQISFSLLVEQFSVIMGALFALLVGKSLLILAAGWAFGLSRVSALRTGLYLASGGEFAFVLFGQAQAAGIISAALCNQLFLVVALSMACTPLLGTLGHFVSTRVTSSAKLQLQPQEGDVDDLKGHVIIAGYGRVGQIIAQVLSERLISFVAVDVRSDNVMKGRNAEVPVYFGDAGSEQVLSTLGAKRASCAVVALDSPGANYRAVWNLSKNYPHLKIFVRARDIAHGLSLEKAGATAVVPETLEPSLQLASAALEELGIPSDEVAASMDNFRREHIAELKELAGLSSGPSFLISSAKTSPPAKEEEAAEPPQEPPAAAVPAPSL
jgi:monovalent cation:proton antiporter-2 (CPA2) family protein